MEYEKLENPFQVDRADMNYQACFKGTHSCGPRPGSHIAIPLGGAASQIL